MYISVFTVTVGEAAKIRCARNCEDMLFFCVPVERFVIF